MLRKKENDPYDAYAEMVDGKGGSGSQQQLSPRRKRCYYSCSILLFIFGGALIAAAALIPPFIHTKIDEKLKESTVLDGPNSTAYPSWASSEDKDAAIISYDVTIFNVTNPDDVQKHGAKPKVEPVGPLKLRYRYRKYNATWLNDNEVVRFKLWEFYTLDESPANIFLNNTNVTTVNMPYFLTQSGNGVFLVFCYDKKRYMEMQGNLFWTQTIGELLFGFDSEVVPFPGLLSNESQKTNSEKNRYIEMYTGKHNNDLSHQYRIYNNFPTIKCFNQLENKFVDAWNTSFSTASKVLGSAGTQFKNGVTKKDTLQVFENTMMRHFGMEYLGNAPAVNGIDTYQFGLPKQLVLNSTEYPPNAAYFSFGPSGLLNSTRCNENMPLFFSKPFFLQGDPELRTNVSLSASEKGLLEKYDTHIDVEPRTGKPFKIEEKLQLNAWISPGLCYNCTSEKNYVCFPNVRETYLPMFWLNKHGEISDSLAHKFKKGVYGNERIAKGIEIGGYSLGAACCILAVVWMMRISKMSAKNLRNTDGSLDNMETSLLRAP